jgi:hypothetical protein
MPLRKLLDDRVLLLPRSVAFDFPVGIPAGVQEAVHVEQIEVAIEIEIGGGRRRAVRMLWRRFVEMYDGLEVYQRRRNAAFPSSPSAPRRLDPSRGRV